MKSLFSLILALLLSSFFVQIQAQYTPGELTAIQKELKQRGEVYFSFLVPSLPLPGWISKTVSIDKIEGQRCFAYANASQIETFQIHGLKINVEKAPSMLIPQSLIDSRSNRSVSDFDFYPTYSEYLQMMQNFESQYPNLCKLIKIGESVEGRDILVLKISDNVNLEENEPEVFYTSTMHGDEVTGYVLMLHLIDYLLSEYTSDAEIATLVDELGIYINPLSNPDGTYAGGNNSLYSATRFNANNIDLNRNYPDPEDGLHPDGNAWQKENQVMMDFMESRHFVLSANFHGGVEVVNYPWDTKEAFHADNDWYESVSRQYVDTLHVYRPQSWTSYFTFMNNGVTNGFEWYTISGGRQDYCNYFLRMREVTIELSNTKIPPPAQLPQFWEANYRSMIQYLQHALGGIRGRVVDAQTQETLQAEITVLNHDFDHSSVFSHPENGWYYRLIEDGNYSLEISAPGYQSKTISGLSVVNGSLIIQNAGLEQLNDIHEEWNMAFQLFPNPASDYIILRTPDQEGLLNIFDLSGRLILQQSISDRMQNINLANLQSGVYQFVFEGANRFSQKIILIRD